MSEALNLTLALIEKMLYLLPQNFTSSIQFHYTVSGLRNELNPI